MATRIRSPRRVLLLSLVVTGLAFALAARAVDAGGGTGTLELVLPEAIESVDPPRASTEAGSTLVANLFERLYGYDYLARPYRLEPCLAAAMPEVSEDGLVWTVRLREDARYLDDPCFPDGKGRAIRASDVAFCLKRLVDAHIDSSARWVFLDRIVGLREFGEASAKVEPDPRRAAYTKADGYPDVKGLEVVDARTLRLRLPRRFPDLAYLLASTFASIYPPEAVARYGADVGKHPVGTGAYRLEIFVPGRSMVLSKNPDYRERTYPSEGTGDDRERGFLADAGRRLPLNDRVVVTFQTDSAAAWNAFLQGRYDRCEIPPSLAPVVLDVAAEAFLPAYREKDLQLAVYPRLEVYFTAFNMQDPVFGRPAGEKGLAIRRAICLADDVAWELENLYRGTAVRITTPLLDEFAESDPTFLAPWARQADESREEALEAARDVLAEAGLAGGEGVPPLEMDVLDYPATRQAFQRFQAQLAAIGLTVRPVYGTWADVRGRINAGKARMWSVNWEADYPSAGTFFEVFYAPGNPDPIAGGYSNPAFDERYETALAATDPEARTEAFRELQEIVCQDCPWSFRFRRLRFDAVQPWLRNYRFNGLVPRFFEYCRIDMAQRNARRR